MTFKCRFNATCFLFKINRFVLIFSKTSNRFVLKICSGGFADYIYINRKYISEKKLNQYIKKYSPYYHDEMIRTNNAAF